MFASSSCCNTAMRSLSCATMPHSMELDTNRKVNNRIRGKTGLGVRLFLQRLLTRVQLLLQVMAEYIWLGASGSDIRSKTKVLDCQPESVEDLPVIAVDGDNCGQATADSCEVYLKPRKIFRDPFRGGEHLLVLCDTHAVNLVSIKGQPLSHPRVHRLGELLLN